MVNTSKLDKDRIDKLYNLSDTELDSYIEKLVLDAYKGFTGGGVKDNPEMDDAFDKLDEITNITLKRNPNCNIKEVIKDRKFIYMELAYFSAVYQFECYKIDAVDNINFKADIIYLNSCYGVLQLLLEMYYDNYSNYSIMEDLLIDLSDDGLAVDSDIREKYLFSKEYGMNSKLMNNLDVIISAIVDLILEKIAELDDKYLVDNSVEINDTIDTIHDNIKEFYKNHDDFDISILNQCGLLDAQLNAIKSIKNQDIKYSEYYLERKKKILDLIDGGNGFAELSANAFENYSNLYDADFDEWIKKEPKYDVRNAKFIYPEISECEYLSLH